MVNESMNDEKMIPEIHYGCSFGGDIDSGHGRRFLAFTPYYSEELARLEKDFVGREWLFQEIDDWINNGDEQIFLLIGEPGIGKSAISSQLVLKRQDIIAKHFYTPFDLGRIDPSTVFRQLIGQLANNILNYYQRLGSKSPLDPYQELSHYLDVDFLRVGKINLETNFELKPFETEKRFFQGVKIDGYYHEKPEEIINDVLKRISVLQPYIKPSIILIDAINIPVSYVFNEISALDWLLKAISVLPPWIKYIFTTRSDQKVFDAIKDFRVLRRTLEPFSEKNLEDIHVYFSLRASSLKIQQKLVSSNINLEALDSQLEERFKGNFLLTKSLFDSIEAGKTLLDEAVLGIIYQKFLKEFFLTRVNWEEKGKPLMGVLAVIQEPITQEQLRHFTNIDGNIVQRVLGRIRQFLAIEDRHDNETFMLFQESLKKYLIDKDNNEYFLCDAIRNHSQISDYYLSQIF